MYFRMTQCYHEGDVAKAFASTSRSITYDTDIRNGATHTELLSD